MRFFLAARSMSWSVITGCDFAARATSASETIGFGACAGWALGAIGRIAHRPAMQALRARWGQEGVRSVAHTAVPLAEEHEGEVLAADRELLAGAPQHGGPAEGLAALAVDLVGRRCRVGQLGLVGRLVHDRLEVRPAEPPPPLPFPTRPPPPPGAPPGGPFGGRGGGGGGPPPPRHPSGTGPGRPSGRWRPGSRHTR